MLTCILLFYSLFYSSFCFLIIVSINVFPFFLYTRCCKSVLLPPEVSGGSASAGDHVNFFLPRHETLFVDKISCDLLVWLDLAPQYILPPLADSNGNIDDFKQG